MGRLWPLTGRDAELREVTAAIRPGAAGIVVSGPAGVGKTRLAREALRRAADRGTRPVWAQGSRAARPFPFGAFAGLVDLPGGDAPGVAQVLTSLLRQRPLVLAVDDAHLLDELSAVVLHRVVVRGLAPVLVTVRAGEPAPDTVTALWKDDLLPRLDLTPFDQATTTALVAEVLRGPVESASAHRLWALTEGSPLFLRHLLDDEVASGRLSPASGIWCWSGDAAVSPVLATLLEQEIGALVPAVQDVVDLVALGEPIAVGTLLQLAPAEAVEEAERRDLVQTEVSADGGTARLAHPLYGEVRRTVMGNLRARRLRGLLASRLDGEADLIQRAVLLMDSDLDPDAALFLQAAETAIGFHDLPLAERLARAAAADGAWHARLVHASTLSWLSRGAEAEAVLRELADNAPDGPSRARVHAHRAGNLLWTLRRPDTARTVLAGALADPDAGPARQMLEAMTAALDGSVGDVPAAMTRALALLDQDVTDDLTMLVIASSVAATAAVGGRLDLLETAATVVGAARLPQAIPVFGLTDWLVLGYRLAGLPGAAEGATTQLCDSSADLPGPARLMGLVLAGHTALATGRPRAALTPLREAWAGLEHSEHEFRFRCRTLLAMSYGMTGQADAAQPFLDGLAVERHPAYVLYAPDNLLAQAWGAAAQGSVTTAARFADAAATLARQQESPAYEVLAWQTATQLGGAADAVPRLEALADSLDGPRAGVALAHARAWAGQDAHGLTAAAEAWEQLGDPVAAGDAAAQAADVHRRQGRQGSALSAAAMAERLSQVSGAWTPALATAVRPLPLTAREREIAVLAARGLSNRAIADHLTVSVRTVEGHLYRIGQKLDIRDRTALADVVLGLD